MTSVDTCKLRRKKNQLGEYIPKIVAITPITNHITEECDVGSEKSFEEYDKTPTFWQEPIKGKVDSGFLTKGTTEYIKNKRKVDKKNSDPNFIFTV